MKALEIAAKYGYYTFDNIPENIKNDDYFSSSKEWSDPKFYETSVPSGLDKIKCIQYGSFAKISEQLTHDGRHDLYKIEFVKTLVFSDKSDFPMMLSFSKGKYYLHPVFEAYKDSRIRTTYGQRDPFLKDLKEPNMIGVFSEKKVEAWIDYCINYVDACQRAYEFVESKKAENLAYIEHVISSVDCKSVERYHNYTIIETNHFTIRFELQDLGFSLGKKVEFRGGIETIIEKNL